MPYKLNPFTGELDYYETSGAGGNTGSISAGTTNASLGEIVFSDSNGVSFGISGQTLTASVVPGSGIGTISAGTQSGTFGELIFSDSNGISFGLDGQTITASIAGGGGTIYVNNSSSTILGAVSFNDNTNGGGVYFGLDAFGVITASAPGAGAIGSIYAGTTDASLGMVTFGNANNVSFGMDTGYVTAAADFAISAGTTDARYSGFSFSDGNGVSFGINGQTVTASVSPAGGGLTNINVSAGTTSNDLSNIVFLDSNGVSFGLDGSTITASYQGSGNISFSAGTTSDNLASLVFSNSNNMSFGLNGSTVTASFDPINIGMSTNGNTGGTTGTFDGAGLQYIFVGSNGIRLSQSSNGSSVSLSVQQFVLSSYENIVGFGTSTFTQSLNPGSVSAAVAFNIQAPLSVSFIRIPAMLTIASTTLTTAAASLSASADAYTTFNAVVYSLGTGANSRNLQSVASGSRGWTVRNSISVGVDGTSGSYSQFITVGAEGNNATFSTQYTSAGGAYSFVTTAMTAFTGSRFLDIDFNNYLNPGNYWLVFGMTTGSASNSARISAATNCRIGYASHQVAGQWNVNFGIMGSTNLSSGGLLGAGSFSTVGGGTTNSIPISAISSSASNIRPYFQMLRSA